MARTVGVVFGLSILFTITSSTWSRIMLCNGDITITLEKPVPPCRLLRTPHIMTNNWKIKLLPNPVGSTAITSLPLKIWRIALSCSFFNEKAIPVSLSFDKTSLKHDSKSTTTHSAILIFLITNLPRKSIFGLALFSVTIWHLNVKPINQINHAAPIRCPVRGRTGFSDLRGFRASVLFFPSPSPLPRPFCSRPILPSSFIALAPFSARPEWRSFFSFGSYGNSYENACYAGKGKITTFDRGGETTFGSSYRRNRKKWGFGKSGFHCSYFETSHNPSLWLQSTAW